MFKIFSCASCGAQKTRITAPERCSSCNGQGTFQVHEGGPSLVFKENVPGSTKSQLVNNQKILKERAKVHIRDNELQDAIAEAGLAVAKKNGWVRPDGRKRRAIDDV